MKNLKKFFSILLVALIAMTSSVLPVNAEKSTSTTKGSITIDNAVKGEDYSIYQMLKIASFDVDDNREGKVSYIVDKYWYDFFATGSYASNFDVTKDAPNGEHYII